MKKLILATIIIAFIILGAPYVTGKVAATQIDNIVSQLNDNSQQNGHTEIVSYQRGFYNSKSLYRIKLPIQYSVLLNNHDEIDFQCDIDHGVISIDYQCNIANNQWYADFIATSFNGVDPVSIFGKVNAFGNLNSNITIAEIKDFKLNDTESINLARTELSVKTDKNLSHYDIIGGTKNFNLMSENQRMLVEDISLGGKLNQLEGGLITGDFSFVIDKMDLTDADSTVTIAGLKTNAIAELNGSNMDSKTQITINSMTLANASFETAKDLSFVAMVNGVNKEALIEYQAYSKKLQNQLLNQDLSTADVNPMDVIPIIERMLGKGFNLSFDLSGKLDDNANLFALNLELLDSVNMSDAMALAYAPQETLNKLNVLITSNFHKDTVIADPKLAASIIDSPLFVESSDEYQMNIQLGPEIELNGETTNVEELTALITATALQHQAQETEAEVEVK